MQDRAERCLTSGMKQDSYMRGDHNEKIRNRYSGDKCVVIGNGLSLTIDLLKRIQRKELFSFVANGFCYVFEKIAFEPDAVCMSNYEAIEKWGFSYPSKTLKFFKAGWREELKSDIEIENVYDLPFVCEHEQGHHFAPFIKDGHFSLDPFAENFCGDTVLLDFAVPLAVYMGFKDVYLCGVDCDYSKGYFDDRYPTSTLGTFQGMMNEDYSIAIPSYRYTKEFLNSWGGGLYKLTDSKRLDFIPTCSVESIY